MSLPNSRIHGIIAFAMTMALVAQQALACSCAVLSICELVEKADVIFLGEVIDGGLDPGEDAWSGRPQSATLRIVESYKGLTSDIKQVTVALMYMPGMCSPAVYRRGEQTLAFLGRPGADGKLRDGACSPSRFAKNAEEDLRYVRNYFAGQTQTRIAGKVAANRPADLVSFVLRSPDGTPVAGAQITAEGNGKRFSVSTNDRGEYAFVGIPAGTYNISADKRGYSRIEDPDSPTRTPIGIPLPKTPQQSGLFPVNVHAGGCAIQDLGLWTRNSLQGTVRDDTGNAVGGIRVFLQKVNGEEDRYGEEVKTNERGEFKFERIDPRPHYLVVSPFGATADSPYESRFYGGADVRERAQVINIEPNSDIRARNIDLGHRIEKRSIRIQLELPDGKPVTNGFIECGDARMPNDRHFDAAEYRNGFVCDALVDRPYRIRVTRVQYTMDLRDTSPVVIPAGKNDTAVTIHVGPQDAAAATKR